MCANVRAWRLAALLALMLAGLALPARPAGAQAGERCFAETGLCISGRIREFWEQNGGLPVCRTASATMGRCIMRTAS